MGTVFPKIKGIVRESLDFEIFRRNFSEKITTSSAN